MKIDKIIEFLEEQKNNKSINYNFLKKANEYVSKIYHSKMIDNKKIRKFKFKFHKSNLNDIIDVLKSLKNILTKSKIDNGTDDLYIVIDSFNAGCIEIILTVAGLLIQIISLIIDIKQGRKNKEDITQFKKEIELIIDNDNIDISEEKEKKKTKIR